MMRWLAFALGTALLTACNEAPASKACLASDHHIGSNDRGDMVWVPGGSAILGSTRFQPEEAPTRSVSVAGFWIDRHEVTNAEFSAFVVATGYRTLAEKSGGAVFHQPDAIGDPSDYRRWWRLDTTANWRMPHGRQGASAQADKPVVQIAYADALAYAKWRGRSLPTEDEWEYAARGGLAQTDYSWGNAPPDGRKRANYWQGVFPMADTAQDGYNGIAPVGCFPPNGFGLYDMAGNVWEITQSRWPRSDDPEMHTIKGGSWLCADNYCLRYRPAARQGADDSLSTDHIGFRTIVREPIGKKR